jgi:hypothetical protein
MDWDTVAKTVGISGILIVVIGFLLRSIFNQLLSIDLANHKKDLEIETMNFQNVLNQKAFEHQTRFSTLHEKRAVVIAELYNQLYQAVYDASLLTSPYDFEGTPPYNERFRQAFASGKSLQEYFESNRIWFSQDICKKIEKFLMDLYRTLKEFQPVIVGIERGHPALDAWEKAWKKISEDIPSLKKDIENEFRGILGVELEKAK